MSSVGLALVILPGLDGSRSLRAAFAAAVSPAFERIIIVEYPVNGAQDLVTLEQFARNALPPDQPFVLLGESFSGPISLRIAAAPPRNLRALVLSTTFARQPTRFHLAAALLAKPLLALAMCIVPMRLLPRSLLRRWLLGRAAPDALVEAVRDQILAIDAGVLRARALAALDADAFETLRRINVSTLYLRACRDRLLRARAAREIVDGIAGARVVEIEGPHLLLQVAPMDCALVVARFAESFGARD